MKKILLLISLLFLITGCYDNIELDDLAIVSGIGIDYIDDSFYLTYEILSDTKTMDNMTLKSYTVSGSGKNISEAFVNTNYKVSKKAYFAHLKVLILSEEVINNHLNKITDYIIRDTNLRSDFKVLVSNNTTPELLLSSNDENHPVASEVIVNLIDNEKYNNNLVIGETFRQILSKLISNNYDVILNTISIKDKEIAINNSYVLNNFKYKTTLSKKDSSLYNLLTKNIKSLEFEKKYKDKVVSITINNSNAEIDVTKDKISIIVNLEGKILENNANFNLKKQNTYKKLNNDFEKVIKKDIEEFIKILQDNNSDILGLQEKYYKKYRKENKNLWTQAKVNIKVNLKINTKGFIFEVENEK